MKKISNSIPRRALSANHNQIVRYDLAANSDAMSMNHNETAVAHIKAAQKQLAFNYSQTQVRAMPARRGGFVQHNQTIVGECKLSANHNQTAVASAAVKGIVMSEGRLVYNHNQTMIRLK